MIDAVTLRRLTEFSRSLLAIREAPQVASRLAEALRVLFPDSPVATALVDRDRAILVPIAAPGAVPSETKPPLEAALAGPIETGTAEGTWLAGPLTVSGNAIGSAAVLIRGHAPTALDRILLEAHLEWEDQASH